MINFLKKLFSNSKKIEIAVNQQNLDINRLFDDFYLKTDIELKYYNKFRKTSKNE